MTDKVVNFSLRFVCSGLRERILPQYCYPDRGMDWWVRWLDLTDGNCEITVGTKTVKIALFADFSGSLPEFPNWIKDIRHQISSCLAFYEQGVDLKLMYVASKGRPAKLTVLNHDTLMGQVEIDGLAVIREFQNFFETAVAFYEKEGIDCTDGKVWVNKVLG